MSDCNRLSSFNFFVCCEEWKTDAAKKTQNLIIYLKNYVSYELKYLFL